MVKRSKRVGHPASEIDAFLPRAGFIDASSPEAIDYKSTNTEAIERRHPAVGVALPRPVHQAVDAGQAEMEDAVRIAGKVEMVGPEKVARAEP